MTRSKGRTFKTIYSLFIFLASICMYAMSSSGAYAVTAQGIRVYPAAQRIASNHKEAMEADITRFKNADNLWDVLRDEFSLPHYESNPHVQEKIEWFMNNQDFLLRAATRSAPYLYYILQQVKNKHLPAELVLLPIVESGYNPFAISSVGAAGIWQMMPDTASSLGIRQDGWYDGRRDIVASTRAALNYLAYLQTFFDGNWLLAIAAYNTGEGNVLSAIRRNIRKGRGTDFWSLPVALQTKNYVPSILALATIISKPDKYPVYFPPVRNAPYLAQIDVRSKINLRYAAKLAGIRYRKLLELNSGFNRPAAKGPYRLILPIENVEQFSENIIRSPYHNKNALAWTHYRVKTGDTIYSIARKFKTTTAAIRKLNHLTKRKARRGTNLLIPIGKAGVRYAKSASKKKTKHYISNSKKTKRYKVAKKVNRKLKRNKKRRIVSKRKVVKKYKIQPGDTVYVVRKNDTVNKIAARYKINPKTLVAVNNIKKILPINKKLIIPTHKKKSTKKVAAKKSTKKRIAKTRYTIKRGDTINKIAKKFKASPAAIRLANLVDDTSLIAGAELVIPSPIKG